MLRRRLSICLVILPFIWGCWLGPSPSPVAPLKGLDGVLVSEVVDSVEAELKALADDSEIIRRHGRLKSIKSTSAERQIAHKAPFGDGGYPACLIITCQCDFELYPDDLTIMVIEGNPKIEWQLEPKEENIPEGCQPKVKNGRLFFARPDGDQLEFQSQLSFTVRNPKFKP